MTYDAQRIRGAIDRTIAEELDRQTKAATDTATPSRSGSTSSRGGAAGGKRTRGAKKPSADLTDAAPNPDPAVFEAAFVIEDSDDPSRAGTPKPPTPEKDGDAGALRNGAEGEKRESSEGRANDGDEKSRGNGEDTETASAPAAQELTPEVRQRLRKLEKLESTYPGEMPP